ncbi:MAG: hypothetical protein VXA88_09620 [Rhodospirillales bacterium]
MSEESVQPSFREQAMQRMAQERDEAPVEPAPQHVAGEEPEEYEDGITEPATEEVVDSDEEFQEGDEEIEPDNQDDDEPPLELKYQRLEKSYKDLQRQFTKDRQERESYNQQISEQMVTMTRAQHELEDTLTNSRQMAELLANEAKGNADRFRNLNWSQVPPEKAQEVQAAMSAAFAREQQVTQALNHIAQQQQQHFEQKMTRQAELAAKSLQMKIPNWGQETYSAIRNHAAEMGLPAEMFNMVTEPAALEMFYHSMMYKGAGKKAKTVAKTKSQKPASANTAKQGRNARGQFMNAKKAFEENPNTRGAFAQMKAAQLAAER